MSISVKNIIKSYDSQKALNKVSFEIKTGEVVGFLGPNGAGKSTMMKILTGYLNPTDGEAEVCGIKTSNNDENYRRNIGYLPEHNPLYLDMYIKEYLMMIAGIYKLDNKNERVQEIIQLTGLENEQHKKIGSLSKGYRQRVGLAQALIHDPAVLILDEPTTGLDPNQIVEVRNLIKKIGKEKTILLSTHIMQEVEAICERVIIINKGELVTDQKTSEISKIASKNNTVVHIEFDQAINPALIKDLDGVDSVENKTPNTYQITTCAQKDIRSDLFHLAVNEGLVILTLTQEQQGLEEIFQELTKEDNNKTLHLNTF